MARGFTISKNTVLAGLLIAAVVTTIGGSRLGQPLRNASQWLLVPFGDPLMYVATELRGNVDRLGSRTLTAREAEDLQTQNDAMRRQIDWLGTQLQEKDDQMAAIQNLRRRLLGPTPDLRVELVPARVVGAPALPYGHSRVVSAGRGAGVGEGSLVTTRIVTDRSKALPPNLAVISAEAMVGVVTSSSAFTATVQLVSDSHFSLRCRVVRQADGREYYGGPESARTRRRLTPQDNPPVDVLAVGDGVEGLLVGKVSRDHQIRPGERLETIPDAAIPFSQFIGTVVAVGPDGGGPGLDQLRVRPAARLDALRDVYVVLGPSQFTESNAGRGN